MKLLRLLGMRRMILTYLCVMLLLLSACSDAGKQLAIAAKTNLEVQKFVIEAQKAGRMTIAETKVVVDATDRIAKVGLSAVAVVERFKSSDPESRTAALDAIGIVADEVGKLQKELKIGNETSRRNVDGLLLAIQTSLNSSRVILAASN